MNFCPCVWSYTSPTPKNAKFPVFPQLCICLSTAPSLKLDLFKQKPDCTKENSLLTSWFIALS